MRARASWLRTGLAVFALVVTACGSVRVVESPTRATAATPAAGRPAHDLAVLGAEINPPLETALQQSATGASLQLLVAVENRGSVAEADVIVEAWLRAPGEHADTVLLSAKTIIPYVTPGEVEIARLTTDGQIPRLQAYTLVVSVRPAPMETFIDNNTHEYSIAVSLPPF